MTDEEYNSEAESNHGVNDIARSLSNAYDCIYSEWIKMNEQYKKMQTPISKLFCEKLSLKVRQ